MERIFGSIIFIIGLVGDCLDIIWWVNLITHWTEWQAVKDAGTPLDLTWITISFAVFGVISAYITVIGFKMATQKE